MVNIIGTGTKRVQLDFDLSKPETNVGGFYVLLHRHDSGMDQKSDWKVFGLFIDKETAMQIGQHLGDYISYKVVETTLHFDEPIRVQKDEVLKRIEKMKGVNNE